MNKRRYKGKIGSILTILTLLVIPAFVIIQPVSSTPTAYYVSTAGNDITGDGSSTNPWRSIQKGVNMIGPGDTLIVKSGRYTEEVQISNKNGTSENWITIKAETKGTVVVDANGFTNTWAGIFRLDASSYIRISGFICRNITSHGIFICGYGNHDIRIDNNTIRNCSSSGIYCYRGINDSSHWIQNVVIDYNYMTELNNNNSGTYWSQEGLSFSGVRGFNVHHNRIEKCNKETVDLKGGTGYGSFHHNIINNTHYTTYQGKTNWGSSLFGLYIDGYWKTAQNISIYNNLIYGNTTGIWCNTGEQTTGLSRNITLYNNIINLSQHNSEKPDGLIIGGYNRHIYNICIYSNTIYTQAGRPIATATPEKYFHNINIKNNIFANENYYQLQFTNINFTSPQFHLSNNLYYRYGNKDHTEWRDGDNQYESTAIKKDPKFISRPTNLHLTTSSPAIDNGTSTLIPSFDFDDTSRPKGNGYDIGAYEYVGVSQDWDINEDGICNLLDLILISEHFGEIGTPGWIREDVDNNGEIQMLDLFFVSNYYGESW